MIINKNKKLIVENISDIEIMLVNEKTEEIHLLNSSSCFLFSICENKSIDDVISLYIQNYTDNVSKDELISDANQIINDFINKGIVIVENKVEKNE